MINIKRSYPEPRALGSEKVKASGTYRHEQIINILRSDFLDKCYICEYKNPTSINVEHLVSHQGNRDLEFSRDNLFWACAHCNNTKLHNYDDILDCTKDDVENCIKYKIDVFPRATPKIEAIENNPKVEKTVELLNKVYNGETPLW